MIMANGDTLIDNTEIAFLYWAFWYSNSFNIFSRRLSLRGTHQTNNSNSPYSKQAKKRQTGLTEFMG